MKSRACSLVAACASLLWPSLAEAATLQSACATVTMTADGRCEVHASFAVSSTEPATIVHRLIVLPDDPLPRVTIAGADAGDVRRVGRTVTVPFGLGVGETSYSLHVTAAAIGRGRCPLPVPDAATDGVSRAVDLEVRLPDDARRLPGAFPALSWVGPVGRITLGHIPAFVLMPHVGAGVTVSWWDALDVRRIVDVSAVVFLVLATGVWVARQRRQG